MNEDEISLRECDAFSVYKASYLHLKCAVAMTFFSCCRSSSRTMPMMLELLDLVQQTEQIVLRRIKLVGLNRRQRACLWGLYANWTIGHNCQDFGYIGPKEINLKFVSAAHNAKQEKFV